MLGLVERDVHIHGEESAAEILGREPCLLVPVSEPAVLPLDLDTYRVRRDRWESGDGRDLVGIREFVGELESLDEPACVASFSGERTTYTLLLSQDWTRVLACVAVNRPA